MTAMSISQDTAATVDSDRAEADEDEEEGTSKNTGETPRRCGDLCVALHRSTVRWCGARSDLLSRLVLPP